MKRSRLPGRSAAASLCLALLAGSLAADEVRFKTGLPSAPYPHPGRAEGYQHEGREYPANAHYRDSSVYICVPDGFRPRDHQIDMVVHFHGWRAKAEEVTGAYRLAAQLAQSQRDAILVVPQGPRDSPDSFWGKLEDPGGFAAFADEVTRTVARRLSRPGSKTGRIVISGHSGAYRVLARITADPQSSARVREVWLFDGLYGEIETFAAYARGGRGRFVNIYTAAGGTLPRSKALGVLLDALQPPALSGTLRDATDAQLRKHRVANVQAYLGHNEVLYATRSFARLLRTSQSFVPIR